MAPGRQRPCCPSCLVEPLPNRPPACRFAPQAGVSRLSREPCQSPPAAIHRLQRAAGLPASPPPRPPMAARPGCWPTASHIKHLVNTSRQRGAQCVSVRARRLEETLHESSPRRRPGVRRHVSRRWSRAGTAVDHPRQGHVADCRFVLLFWYPLLTPLTCQ